MATIGCRNLKMCEMNDLEQETYDTLVKAFDTVKTINLTPSTWEAKNTYNDRVGEVITGFSSIEVSINTKDLTPEELGWLFGCEKDSAGVYVFKDTDVPKTVAIMFESLLSDQKNYRYTCLYRGKFKLPQEAYETKVEGAPNFKDKQIVGTFIPLKNGNYKAQVDSTDATASTAIEEWYTKPYGTGV